MRTTCVFVQACLVLGMLTGTAVAQSQTGTIYGVVRDATGWSLPATVTAADRGRPFRARRRPTARADSSLPCCRSGAMRSRSASRDSTRRASADVPLETQQNREVDFALSLSGVQETTTVTAASVLLDIERRTSALGQVINSQQVADLPLNGRNFVQLRHTGARRREG